LVQNKVTGNLHRCPGPISGLGCRVLLSWRRQDGRCRLEKLGYGALSRLRTVPLTLSKTGGHSSDLGLLDRFLRCLAARRSPGPFASRWTRLWAKV